MTIPTFFVGEGRARDGVIYLVSRNECGFVRSVTCGSCIDMSIEVCGYPILKQGLAVKLNTWSNP